MSDGGRPAERALQLVTFFYFIFLNREQHELKKNRESYDWIVAWFPLCAAVLSTQTTAKQPCTQEDSRNQHMDNRICISTFTHMGNQESWRSVLPYGFTEAHIMKGQR